VRIISKNIARDSIWNRYDYIFEPIPEKNSAIASGATPIGSAVAHPIERSTEEKWEIEGNNKEPASRQVV
jgi:hypothetical protein